MSSVPGPRVELVWRVDGVAKGIGLGPVPVHGLRHIQTVQPQLTIPPRTDFEIRWDMSCSAHIESAFQISFRQELVEIRDIGTPRPRADSCPVRIADSRKGCLPRWAEPRSLAPRLTLSQARFRFSGSDVEGGLGMSVQAILDVAREYEQWEASGTRTWAIQITSALQRLFGLTHYVGTNPIVADPLFS